MSCLRKKVSPLVGLCLLFTGAFLFYACGGDDQGEVPTNWVDGNTGYLVGTWKHIYGGGTSIINVNAAEFKYQDSGTYVPEGSTEIASYSSVSKGDIAAHTDYTEKYGVIVFKVTEDTYNSAQVNKYTAAYWKERTGTTAMVSTVYRDGSAEYFASLEDAKAAFTNAKAGDWVGTWGGPYTKQP